MKRLLAIPLLFLMAATAMGQGTNWFQGSLEQAIDKAADENKHVLIFFYSRG